MDIFILLRICIYLHVFGVLVRWWNNLNLIYDMGYSSKKFIAAVRMGKEQEVAAFLDQGVRIESKDQVNKWMDLTEESAGRNVCN